jgi:hypothetical protein
MTKLLDGGVEITALHNHLLRADPPIYYMHVGGHGDPVKMAQTIHSALSASKTPFEVGQGATPPTASVDLPTAQLDEIMKAKGQSNGGVYQFGIPRKDTISEGGMAVPGAMVRRTPSISSRLVAARRRSRVTSSLRAMRSIR